MRTDQTRRALITGGTSGIGLAVAYALAELGDAVFVCARDADRVDETVTRLQAQGFSAAGQAADVRRKEDVQAVVAAATDEFGNIDILVNNAGRTGGGVTADLPDDLWYDVLDTNLNSVFLMSREVLKSSGMLNTGWGRIINVASTAGKQGVVLGAPYSASKHGVVGFTKALGLELAKSGVTVNAVCPGYVETPMAQRVRANYAQHFDTSEAEILQRFQAKIPLGRYTLPEEVAALVTYLASPAANPITAQAINVCGGLGNF